MNVNLSNEEIDGFMKYIISIGVFGDIQISHICNNIKDNSKKKVNVKELFFPSYNNLNIKYSYAKKHKLLLPIAWIHRIIYNIKKSENRGIYKRVYNVTREKEKILNMLRLQ